MTDGLQALLGASEEEKKARGIQYTPREIVHQPETWQKTYAICGERRQELSQFLRESGIGPGEQGRPTVFLVGAGTSDYIGGALTLLLRRMWGCEVWAVPSTSLLTNLEDLVFADQPYLWVSFSRSGDSPEGLGVIDAALQKYPKVRHLLVTCNQQGRMASICEQAPDRAFVLALDDTANDRGLAMTSSYTNMVIAGHCIAHVSSPDDYLDTFSILQKAGERFLGGAEEVATTIARENFSKACFVGSGALQAVARESALKLLELTAGKIQTMSESTLGLRHGPMSALDGDTLFVSFLSRDLRRRNYELDLLREVNRKQLGKQIVVVTPYETDGLSHLADHVLSLDVPALSDEYRPPVDVILAQLLGLFCSLRLGLQPDCPSPNGVISRVVSNVKIYA
ncbi:MAG: SIS domain-containing protein [Terriglobales bacterium]|jgi:tagatose-6-phosphate ketose/aldose isomerase